MIRPTQRRLAVILGAAALALGAAAPASAGAPSDFVGLSSDDVFAGDGGYRAQALDRQRAAGVGLLRQNWDWAAIERSPGRFDFSAYDAYVAATAARGIRILPVLYHPPRFHARGGGRHGVYPPRSYRAMGRFAAAIVRRWGPRGSFWRQYPGVPKVPIRSWQVWNEPSVPVYWRPRPSIRGYTKMLRTVARYIKRADRRAEVVTAGLPVTKLRSAIRLGRFLRGMYRAGGRSGFTTLAINAYSRNTREMSRIVRGVRRIMRRYRDGRARLWITELGWGTGGPKHRFNVGTAAQASRIGSAVKWLARKRRRMRLRGFVYFQWRDQRPYPPHYRDLWGLHTGLLDVAGRPKPALFAFSGAARRVR
jgi:polysaccharide biosynthesis protein PslG